MRLLLVLVLLLPLACVGSTIEFLENCVAGESAACACSDGSQGAQVCSGDGKSYGACSCSGGGDGLCAQGFTMCGTPDAGEVSYPLLCVDTQIDPNNCGACGVACGTRGCASGACGPCMPPGSVICESDSDCCSGHCGTVQVGKCL